MIHVTQITWYMKDSCQQPRQQQTFLQKMAKTFASWIDILQSCNFYPATKTEWADVKQGVIEVEQNALLGDDVQTLLDDLQADIAG